MTTIAVDTKLTMAADTQATVNDRREQHAVPKIFEVGGFTIGVAGRYSEALAFVEAFEDILETQRIRETTHLTIPESVMGEFDNFNAIVIAPTGDVFMYEGSRFSIPIEAPCAIGSGADFALAAMECEADAQKAVSVAIKFDIYSGGSIDVVPFSDKTRTPNREEWEKKTKKEILNELFGTEDDSEAEENRD